jgi:hypothetical protein
MGKTAAEMIRKRQYLKIENPYIFLPRKSL